MRTASELAEKRTRYAKALDQDLDSLVAQLRALPEVCQVILFGSFALGRRDLFTDLDLIVVLDSPLDFVSRGAALARRLRARVALDLLVYTPHEFEQLRHRPFLRQALATAKVLYEREFQS
jgi:predicted nucleotidyltransferase